MDVLQGLAEHGAVYKDHHFVYKKKTHGPHYINPDAFCPDVLFLNEVCEEIADHFKADDIDVVVCAATGGIPVGFLVGLALAREVGRKVKVVWADKDGDNFVFERVGFKEIIKGKRILFVEDLLNSGDTTLKVLSLVREAGGEVVAAAAICNRGGATEETLGVPRFVPLSSVNFEAFEPDACPLCPQEVPIVDNIGHGDAFKEQHPDYEGGYVSL